MCLFPFIPSSFTNLIHNLHIIVSLFSLFLFKFSNSFQFFIFIWRFEENLCDRPSSHRAGRGCWEEKVHKKISPLGPQLVRGANWFGFKPEMNIVSRRDETSSPYRWKCLIVSHPQCKRYTELKNWIIPEGIYVRSITKLRCKYPPLTHSIIFREVHIIKIRFLLLHSTQRWMWKRREPFLMSSSSVVCQARSGSCRDNDNQQPGIRIKVHDDNKCLWDLTFTFFLQSDIQITTQQIKHMLWLNVSLRPHPSTSASSCGWATFSWTGRWNLTLIGCTAG